MIKAVIFDMYETLVTLWHSNPYTGKEISFDAGIPENVFREIWDATESDRTLGRLRYEEVIERILRKNNKYSKELYDLLVLKRKNTNSESFKCINENIIPMFDALKKAGIKTGLVTNCYFEEEAAIKESIIFPYFDYVCMSCRMGIKKPDEQIFIKCLEGLNVMPSECIYCGDGGNYELEAAQRLGMKPVQALWYLKNDSRHSRGRIKDFAGADNPMDIVTMIK